MRGGFLVGRFLLMITNSLEETYSLAEEFVSSLSPDTETATVIGLSGDLGAGKTSFTQGVAKALGVKDTVTSPTFIIEKNYELNNSKFRNLIHIDAYRLDEERELEVLGFKELLEHPENLIFVEWPERVQEIIPEYAKTIDFKFIDENKREINI